jgi:hypothetical protein
MVSFLTVMSHLILQTSLTPSLLLKDFFNLRAHHPAFVNCWESSRNQEILLELTIAHTDHTRHEYLSLRSQSQNHLILHLLAEGEEIAYQSIRPALTGLLNWLQTQDPQIQLIRHTFGYPLALSTPSLP